MTIQIIRTQATPSQVREMLDAQGSFIKLAVDVRERIVADGGEMPADCEAVLLKLGSEQDDVWGADWYPAAAQVGFESFINIRPRLGNRTMVIQDPARRDLVEEIVRERFQ